MDGAGKSRHVSVGVEDGTDNDGASCDDDEEKVEDNETEYDGGGGDGLRLR